MNAIEMFLFLNSTIYLFIIVWVILQPKGESYLEKQGKQRLVQNVCVGGRLRDFLFWPVHMLMQLFCIKHTEPDAFVSFILSFLVNNILSAL